MEGELIEVWTDVGLKKPKPLLARVVASSSKHTVIQYLSPTEDRIKGKTIYRYEEDTYHIGEDSIYKRHKNSNEFDLGYSEIPEGYIKEDSDIDYVPSEEEGADEESFEDSDEESNDEEYDDEEDYYDDEE